MLRELSGAVADWAHTAYSKSEVPESGHAAAGEHLIDTVAVAIAGIGEAPVDSIRRATRARGDTGRLALVLGTAAHALDYDNAQTPSLVHPGCVIVPTAIAIAHEGPGSGAHDLLRAIAIGEEISLWLGETAVTDGNSILFERGFHPTAVCTPIGAAVTAGLLRGLAPEQLAHAIGTAASLSGGILEGNRTGGQTKPMHAGFASTAGVLAAELAAAGATAPPTALEGRFGFLQAFLGVDPAEVRWPTETAGAWRIESVTTKPYPTNGFTHSSIDAALQLRAQGFRLEPGAALRIGVAEPVLRTIAFPEAVKYAPPTAYAARFSGPVVVAMALLGGSGLGVGLADFDGENAMDERILAAARRVRFEADPEATAAFPDRVVAFAVGIDSEGGQYRVDIDTGRGSPGNPLSQRELRTKFDDCVMPRLGTATAALWETLRASINGDDTACAAVISTLAEHFG
ncbi:MmgE/PrpD family protein [Nocardia sp. NPDC059228]|uniref:MmgE/PrpD family protein n=1 Tax=Nocardia sp. NPDC059228 TaxID=3346777 RepID=UPI0036ADD331